jgi:YidC/Oxa1 family membrane protein insertase
VNKNTLFAFILILATLALFTSPTYQRFYYTTILKQKPPENIAINQKTAESTTTIKKRENIQKSDTINTLKETISADIPEKKNNKLQKGDTIWIETETLIVGISEIGAKIISLQMKEYNINHRPINDSNSAHKDRGYVELLANEASGGAEIVINNTSYNETMFLLEKEMEGKTIRVKKGEDREISFTARDVFGNEIKKQFLFKGEGYKIGFNIRNNQLNNNRLTISWPAGITESEKTAGLYQSEERKAHYFDGQNVLHVQSNKPNKEEATGLFKWIGVSSKYFFVAMVADTERDADLRIISFEEGTKTDKDGKKNKAKKINYSIYYQITVQGNEASFWIYAGPSKFKELKKNNLKFEKILFPVLGWTKIFFWADRWFPWIAEFVLWLLLGLFSFSKDYGVSILLLTILTRVVTYPLTQSSMKSMSRMKDLQPKINILRQKHKTNPRKMNEEIMALYKNEGVNPLNPGCLPMFLQMPIFIALFVVLRKAIELRGAGTILVPWIHDLSQPESLFSLEKLIPNGIPMYGSNFAVLPIIMAVLTYFQNKATIKDPNQKMLIYFMPVFMLVLFNNFPSGLVLYWTLSSALGLLQQYYTDRKRRKTEGEPKLAIVKKR